ncbi:MAG: L,D-transpeptidase family protein [Acidobacteriia bacterium]|nr:L,D-transpeptidase family protein [Terriglobia bacterium]
MAAILLGAAACAHAAAEPSSGKVSAAIEALIDGRHQPLGVLTPGQQAELRDCYRAGGYAPLWLDSGSRPDRDARDARAVLNGAADDGLDPADYYRSRLDRLASVLQAESPALPGELAAFDVALSAGLLRYMRDLHLGRVDPRTIGFRFSVPGDRHDLAALLGAARADHRIAGIAADLRPSLARYGELRAALLRYRAFAADAELAAPLPLPAAAGPVRPGEAYDGARRLWRLLSAFGDLAAGTPPPADSARYEGALVDGVKRFQIRHGLEPDGVLGRSTLAALRIPLTRRVRQIELALERLRWLPHLVDQRLVFINIPMFRLWAWDALPPSGAPSVGMDVIVGRALNTQTPVFVEEMREVIFRPYWNVPPSILRHEVLPMIERDPGYLQREDMEIVRGAGDDAEPVDATAENLGRLRQGALRLRQRPGSRNALGLIKFVFPNEQNVYMHGTPAQALFSRRRRDFSHGCVRVEDPLALAEWALADRPEWTRNEILAAAEGSQSIHVKLTRPIQVILFYTTAAVTPEDGTLRFADDIYRHDARLDRALAARRFAR